MVYARFVYKEKFEQMHNGLVQYIKLKYPDSQHGLQCDSWIWIAEGNQKVAIDTFSSMQHEVKSKNGRTELLNEVIAHLNRNYKLKVLEEPELEPDE